MKKCKVGWHCWHTERASYFRDIPSGHGSFSPVPKISQECSDKICCYCGKKKTVEVSYYGY